MAEIIFTKLKIFQVINYPFSRILAAILVKNVQNIKKNGLI